MNRQEDFIHAGINYRMEHGKPMAIGGDNFAEIAKEMNRCKDFEFGADYGYQYAVDKACEWLEKHLLNVEADGYMTTDLFKQFRKAMEELLRKEANNERQ